MESTNVTPTPFSQSTLIAPAESSPSRSCRQQAILVWAILATMALVLTWACLIGGFVALMAWTKDPPLGVQVDYPLTARQGETFELVVNLRNSGASSLTVQNINLDVAQGSPILNGANIERTQPALKRENGAAGAMTFTYDQVLAPGEERQLAFTLKAVTIGEYVSDLEIYTDQGWHTIPVALGVLSR